MPFKSVRWVRAPPVFLILLFLPAAEETAWQRIGALRRYLTVVENELAVHQNVLDARTGLVRRLERRPIRNHGRVEHDQIGEVVFSDPPAFDQPETNGWKAAELIDGVFERECRLVADPGTEQAAHSTVDAGMDTSIGK